jgi:hypothetical protein
MTFRALETHNCISELKKQVKKLQEERKEDKNEIRSL